MNVYMTRINGLSFKDTIQYRQHMTVKIAHQLGIKEMGIYRYNLGVESDESLSARVDGIIAGINREDLVICQFPTGNGLKFEWKLINHLKAYGGRIAVFLQELEPLLYEKKGSTLQDVINLYNQAEVMIVPSLAMRQFLLENHIRNRMKFVIQEMWDYTNNVSFSQTPKFKKEFLLISDGELGEIGKWSPALPLKLYGKASVSGGNIHSINDMKPDEMFAEIAEGGFGLIWYKNTYERQYMEYSISFSMAKFLAAGIPVVAPVGISNQTMIEVNHLGLIVNSLDEAVAKIEVLGETEYQGYVQCVKRFATALHNGYYTERCLVEAMQAFYSEDAGKISIPMNVYSLENPVFFTAVLKESYGGNLALSWNFKGNTDGFLIYDGIGRLVTEINNVHQHYFLIRGYGKDSSFIIKAYMETLKGKLVIAESKSICLDVKIHEIPRVSLIIPVYNAEKYVIRSIDTALAQSFSDLEVIIVDDGSTDETPNILEWYAEKYANVKVIHQENNGVPAARNTGLMQANGEYIGFMDSDDMIYPNMIARLYHSARKNNCDIAVTSVYYITNTNYDISEFSQYPVEEDIAIDAEKFINMHSIIAYQFPVVWNKLYRASLVKSLSFPIMIYEDEAWIPYVLSFADRICYLNEGLYEYDRSVCENTLSRKLSKGSNAEIFANHKRAILFYLKNSNLMRMKALKRLAQKELSLFARRYKNLEYGKLWEQIKEI